MGTRTILPIHIAHFLYVVVVADLGVFFRFHGACCFYDVSMVLMETEVMGSRVPWRLLFCGSWPELNSGSR
jgi:hypothetical protein